MKWLSEALIIDVWEGARIRNFSGNTRGLAVRKFDIPGSSGWTILRWKEKTLHALSYDTTILFDSDKAILDLEHPGMRSEFDRHLARRLGAPEEAVDEGVVFYPEDGAWILHGGVTQGRFTRRGLAVGVEDFILARVIAWKEV